MASVYATMKGKFGSTEYFMLRMKAMDVANKLVIPKEMRGWEDLALEERFQRAIDYNRVKKQIAPYLSNDPDRFFGALIVSVINDEGMGFEPASKKLSGISELDQLHKTEAKSFGFLTLSGDEVLVPLDGQHRFAALQAAITGKDEKQKEIPGVTPNPELAKDDVMLIMIRHDIKKGSKIFNKVNRYAKATTKADNLITADDDIVAIVSREIVANELIGGRLVNYESNTLSDKTHYFTTLSTIYDATKQVLENKFGRIDTQTLPSRNQKLYRETTEEYWGRLLKGVEIYRSALAVKGKDGDEKRIEIRKTLLLGKPISQFALMLAVIRLKNMEDSDGSKLPWDTIIKRINEVDWANNKPLWQKILMNGSRIITGKQERLFASQFIAYYLGEPLKKPDLDNLREGYASNFAEEERSKVRLPPRLFKPK